jgi:hypothetical protein
MKILPPQKTRNEFQWTSEKLNPHKSLSKILKILFKQTHKFEVVQWISFVIKFRKSEKHSILNENSCVAWVKTEIEKFLTIQ